MILVNAFQEPAAACPVCPHHCILKEGQTGLCHARKNVNGQIIAENYGRITSYALDPIEKKPLARFHPGALLLSVGSYGCNMTCPFCQNASISTVGLGDVEWEEIQPEQLVEQTLALREHDSRVIGIAYTYNEPLISYEFVRDSARRARASGLVNVVVSNGMVSEDILAQVIPFIDAFNIDLKTYNPTIYQRWGGDLYAVKQAIALASKVSHVEVTTLIIPGVNDSVEEIDETAQWLASINPDTPYHLSRFFPCYRMMNCGSTPIEQVYMLAARARRYLNFVYTGNC